MLLIVCDTLRRVFGEVKTFDWTMLVVELLVLGLIAYEVAHNLFIESKRRKGLKATVKMITDGAYLHQRATLLTSPQMINEWVAEVEAWSILVSDQLDTYSTQASSAFSFVEAEEKLYPRVPSEIRKAYGDLKLRLEMLRRIMENPCFDLVEMP